MRAAFAIPSFLFLSVLTLLAGCSSTDTVALRVDVRTDWVPVVEFSEIEVSVEGASDAQSYNARFDDDFLTGVRVANLESVPTGTLTVRARILAADGRRLVERRVTAEVTSSTTLTLVFTRSCAAVSCPNGDDPSATECVGGRCVSPECSPENPEACGEGGCESDDDCGSAPVGCARTICTAGECFVGSDFSACAATEYCNPEEGCVPRPVEMIDAGTVVGMDAGVVGTDAGTDAGLPAECGMPCDTGNACETGVYDCSEGVPTCVRDELLAAGTSCRGSTGACDIPETCDGASPVCPMDAFQPTGASCPAGFCDGLGTCSDGCTPGASCSTGNPCETGEIVCDTGAPVCVRAGNAPNGTSCAATENGSWGSCGGYSGACDETGTRSRSVTTYACQAGTCEPSTSSETEACGRSTDGSSCGTTSTGSWGTCGGFGSTCDESGTQSRSVTSYTCAAGTCNAATNSESRGCTRNTDGSSCGSTSYGSWGTCGGYSGTCDETGTQSRSVTTLTCGSGTCGSSTSSQSRACSRTTDGSSCGTTTYGSWSSCGGYSGTCDETGTRSRSVTTYTCGSGSCNSSTSSQSGSCTRDTDGTTCGSTTYGTWGSCGGFSTACDETGTRSRTNTIRQCATGSCQTSSQTENQACSRDTDGQACPGIPFGCNDYYCNNGSCQSYYRCLGGQQCCEDFCTSALCP